MDNAQIARTFDELADLPELAGEDPGKLRAYRDLAESVREHGEPLEALAKRGALGDVEGADVAKIEELLATGTFEALEHARAAVPASLLEVLRLPLAPKTVRAMWQSVGVTSLAELVRAGEEGKVAAIRRVGKKKLRKAIVLATEDRAGGG